MRSRVLLPLMLCVVVAVLALVIPAMESIAAVRTQQLTLARTASLNRIVLLATSAAETRETAILWRYLERFHDLYGEAVLVVGADGDTLASVGSLDPTTTEVAAYVVAARRNLPRLELALLRPWSERYALIAAPIAGDGDINRGAVVLRVDQAPARDDVTGVWLILGAGALLLLVALAVFALWWTRWILRPVRRLGEATSALAEGQYQREVRYFGPPELRKLASSFDRMADTITATLRQQRDLVSDTSHQLRNPLAAARLRIDDLRLRRLGDGTAVQTAVAEVDADLERLERTVDRLLTLADAERRATAAIAGADPSDREGGVVQVLTSAGDLARPSAALIRNAGLRLVADDRQRVLVACRRSDLEEIVATLLDNAVKYAGDGATIEVTIAPRDDRVVVSVSDDGPGLSPDELTRAGGRFWRSPRHRDVRGSGLGLAISSQLARANHGSMTLDSVEGGGLRVDLEFRTVSDEP